MEGTETSVMSDNPEVHNYMIQLSETLEASRSEVLMGWYHSHPFDVGPHSNAFLSATDVSTQMSWQLPEDNAGNPWLALVVDPLRSLAKGTPEIGAFRCYPPSYQPPAGLAPDGVQWADTRACKTRWGDVCNAYYALSVEYFASGPAVSLLEVLATDFLWARSLSSTPALDGETRERLPDRLRALGAKLGSVDPAGLGKGGAAVLAALGKGRGVGAAGGGGVGPTSALAEAAAISDALRDELTRTAANQAVKSEVFGASCGCAVKLAAVVEAARGGQ